MSLKSFSPSSTNSSAWSRQSKGPWTANPSSILASAPSADVNALLGVLVGGAIDLRHEDTTPVDRRRQSIADLLAQALDIDMTQVWQADIDYWLRLPKAALIDALAQAGDDASAATASAGLLASCAKLKKDALAQGVESAWSGRGYLPDLLVTPVAAGAFVLTETGACAVAAE